MADFNSNNNKTDEAPPPSYREATSADPVAPSSQPQPSAGNNTPASFYTAHLTAHLAALPARIRQRHTQAATHQAARDLDLVALLAAHVESFLSDLGSLPRCPPLAELTLVPDAAVPASARWALSGARERRREGEVVALARVAAPLGDGEGKGREREADVPGVGEKPRGNSSGNDDDDGGDDCVEGQREGGGSRARDWSAPQFDEWGRFEDDGDDGLAQGQGHDHDDGSASAPAAATWWWRDEAQARRLASHLQPRPEPNLGRRRVQETVAARAKEEKRSWGWWGSKGTTSANADGFKSGIRRTVSGTDGPSPVPSWGDHKSGPGPVRRGNRDDVGSDEAVNMTVLAEEVTFRRENDLGIWESMTGWGIVVTIKMRAA